VGKARSNPIGMKKPPGVTAVRIGEGKMVHCYSPDLGTLCESGKGRALVPQDLYSSGAKFINCYRCAKLMTMNLEAGRKAWVHK